MKQFSVILILLIFQAALCCIASAQGELWLKFDEGKGKAAFDSSGNGRDGRLVAFQAEFWVDGMFDKGLMFGMKEEWRDTDRVVVPYFDTLSSETFTAEAWIYPTGLPVEGIDVDAIDIIFDRVAGGLNGWMLALEFKKGVVVPVFSIYSEGDWVSASGKTPLEVEKWYSIAGVCDNGNLIVYLDGEEEGSAKYQPPRITNKTDLWIGGYQQRPPERGFYGIMDDVQFSAVAKRQKQLAYSRWKDVSPKAKLATYWARLKIDD